MLYQQRKPKIDDWKKTELHNAKEYAYVRFATWPKTFSFLPNGNCFLRLRINILPVLVVTEAKTANG